MKKLIVFVFIILNMPFLYAIDGNKLYKDCKTINAENFDKVSTIALNDLSYCFGYIDGTLQMMRISDIVYPEGKIINIPGNVEQDQIIKIIVKYLVDHPEELHIDAGIIILKSLKNSFPNDKTGGKK